ncbi:MAG: hypothetical protein ABI729_00175 [Chitinophagales bacterium]
MNVLHTKKIFRSVTLVFISIAHPIKTSLVFRSIFVIIFLLFFNSLPIFSQTKKEIKSRGINAVTVNTFDARKKDTTGRKSFTRYDQRGNVVESIEYDVNGNTKSHEQFEYNRQDQETTFRTIDTNGKVLKTIFTSYDKWNHVAEKSTTDSVGSTIEKNVNSYNTLNDLTEESTFDKDGKLIRHVLYSYDNKGMLLSRKVYNEKGELIYSKEYTYQY